MYADPNILSAATLNTIFDQIHITWMSPIFRLSQRNSDVMRTEEHPVDAWNSGQFIQSLISCFTFNPDNQKIIRIEPVEKKRYFSLICSPVRIGFNCAPLSGR